MAKEMATRTITANIAIVLLLREVDQRSQGATRKAKLPSPASNISKTDGWLIPSLATEMLTAVARQPSQTLGLPRMTISRAGIKSEEMKNTSATTRSTSDALLICLTFELTGLRQRDGAGRE